MFLFRMTTVLQCILLVALCCLPAESCRGGVLLRTGVTQAEKYQIMEAHNKLRSSVAQGQVPNQPGAQNMQEMVWDDELAAKAQQWANQCYFEHDPSRYLDRFTMGQNLAIIWSTAPLAEDDGDFPSRIQNWFNEVRKYAWGSAWSAATGHYSQLVWGDTNLIGCGFSYYQDARRFNKLYVCNYGPGGNVVGNNPYEVGSPSCGNYGMYPSSRYSGLCLNNGVTQPTYSPENNIITQHTYTFKSERINPPTYQTYRKPASANNFNYKSNYNTYTQSRPSTAVQTYQNALQSYQQPRIQTSDAVGLYQQALQAYQSPHSSYSDSQKAYQRVLTAYSQAYPSQPSSTSYYQPAQTQTTNAAGYSNYNWSNYLRKGFTYK